MYPCQLDFCFKVYTANRRAALPPNPQRQLLSSAAALRKTRINATPGSPLCAADPRLRGLISSGSADCRLSSKPRVFLFFRDLRPEQKSYILCRSHPYPRGKEENVVKGRKVLSHLIHRSGVRLTILYVPLPFKGPNVCAVCCLCVPIAARAALLIFCVFLGQLWNGRAAPEDDAFGKRGWDEHTNSH